MNPHSPSSCCPRLRAGARRLAGSPPDVLAALFAPRLSLDVPYPVRFRERLFTPLRTFWLFLAQVLSPGGSCAEAVQRALAWFAATDGPDASPNTSAYCQARCRLNGAWLTAISQRATEHVERQTPESWLWHGHPVKVPDGSSVSMPDTPENQARWPQPKGQRPGCGFPIARIAGVFSLATGSLLALANGSLHSHERLLFRRLIDSVLRPGDIALADRGFCSFADFYQLLRRNVNSVMRRHARLKHDVGLRRVGRLGRGDLLMDWHRCAVPSDGYTHAEWNALPETLRVREITVPVTIPGFRTRMIVLLTTLLDPAEYPARDFADLYRRRWEVETDLRHIKTTLRMEVLRGKSPEMIEKELTAYQIAYNLIRGLMIEAAGSRDLGLASISFKATAAAVRHWAPLLSRADDEDLLCLHERFLASIARHPVPQRPNRNEPRALKRRPKNYPRLTQPRHSYREILHRNRYTKARKPERPTSPR